MEIRRGDIVFVKIRGATGHETKKDRPAIVVSHDALNYTGEVISVVYLTSSQGPDYPSHVTIKSTQNTQHRTSIAMCEHVYSLDKSRVMKRIGSCTDVEMRAVERGIMISMGLAHQPDSDVLEDAELLAADLRVAQGKLELARQEADTYKHLYREILDKLLQGGMTA